MKASEWTGFWNLKSPVRQGVSLLKIDEEKDIEGEFNAEDDERWLRKTREYERTIEALMKEVSRLKQQVFLSYNYECWFILK